MSGSIKSTNFEVIDSSFCNTSVRRVTEISDVNHPNQDTNHCNNLRQQISKIVNFLFEGSFAADLRGDGGMDVSDGGFGAGGGHDRFCCAVHYCCSL